MEKPSRYRLPGLLALSPLILFAVAYLTAGIVVGDFYKVPLSVVFLGVSIYAIALMPNISMSRRINIFSRGASSRNLLLMIWIFVLAGAFASSAKAMGAIDSTVNLSLHLLPGNLMLAGMFIAACFISLSIGTSVGTIVALVPVASGLALKTGIDLPLMTAATVGGAMFGDNLSFISDTTVVATRTQGCKLSDKFRVNIRIVLPAAIASALLYVGIGWGTHPIADIASIEYIKLIPYLAVLILALSGMNVLLVLTIGNLLTGIVGVATSTFGFSDWVSTMGEGISSMGELILISMMAGGLLEVIRHNGGIDYLIQRLTRYIHGPRGAEASIATLVSLTNFCTANNTVAILSVGNLAHDIAERFGVDPRKTASILDTFSCFIQGIIPYGAQLLMAAGLAKINPVNIIPFLYYPFLMGFCAILSIIFRYPRKFEQKKSTQEA